MRHWTEEDQKKFESEIERMKQVEEEVKKRIEALTIWDAIEVTKALLGPSAPNPTPNRDVKILSGVTNVEPTRENP